MGAPRYTTPVEEFTIQGFDLTHADVYVTYKQGNVIVTFNNPEVTYEDDTTTVRVHFSQEQSSQFKADRDVDVQINWMLDDERNATEIKTVVFNKNLLEQILEGD